MGASLSPTGRRRPLPFSAPRKNTSRPKINPSLSFVTTRPAPPFPLVKRGTRTLHGLLAGSRSASQSHGTAGCARLSSGP